MDSFNGDRTNDVALNNILLPLFSHSVEKLNSCLI